MEASEDGDVDESALADEGFTMSDTYHTVGVFGPFEGVFSHVSIS